MDSGSAETSLSEADHLLDQLARTGIDKKILKVITPNVLAKLVPIISGKANLQKGVQNRPGDETEAQETESADTTQDEEIENVDESSPSPSTRKEFSPRIPYCIRTFSVKKSLSDDPDGSIILSSYNRTQSLIPNTRNRIVNIIVRCARKLQPRLYNESFEILAKKIVQVFPTENERTYYVPPTKKKDSSIGSSVPSKGKLPVMYRNARQKCQKFTKSTTRAKPEKALTNDAKVEESKKWLSVNNSPWETVVEHWDITRQFRKHDLKEDATAVIGTFIEEWPILKHPNAYLLIEKDFSELGLTEIHINATNWNSFFEELKSIRPINPRDTNAVALNELLTVEINENTKAAVQILLLPHIIPPSKKVLRNWKPTICESKDSLLIHVQNAGSMIHEREQREKTVKRHKQPLQPFIFAVGPTMTEILESYVCVGKILYKVPSVLKALEGCFQIFHVLDTKYPVESQHLWSLIREGFYGMVPECGSNVAELMTDLKSYRQKLAKAGQQNECQSLGESGGNDNKTSTAPEQVAEATSGETTSKDLTDSDDEM